jgi:hypothetical protein
MKCNKGTPALDVGHPKHVFEALVEDGEIKLGSGSGHRVR